MNRTIRHAAKATLGMTGSTPASSVVTTNDGIVLVGRKRITGTR
ncbi:hypothetical protein [Kitasatospora sp. NPDC059673]